jgi:transposase
MRQRDKQAPQSAEETVRDIPRATRRHFSAEEKIRIVLEGLRGEDSIENVETSHLPVRRTLDKIGIFKTTFYAWLDRYAAGGLDALEDHRDDLELLGCGVSHSPSSPSAITLFLSRRFSRVTSAPP